MDIKGIIHIGAHYAEEHKDYIKEGVRKVAYIEASQSSFFKLCRINLEGEVELHNVALADYEGVTEMYTETDNQGQSSSLLKPGTHTKHYPSIVFNKRETVLVTTLDKLKLSGYNMLNMDVQGAELMVLRGSTKTLENIDYIYTEINTEQVYEGCAQLSDIDTFLGDLGFERVEIVMTGQGWGDAFYTRKVKGGNIVTVPKHLMPAMPHAYPMNNKHEFERWFFDNIKPMDITGRTYLPIFWTAYYVKANHGQLKAHIQHLQDFLNKLDKRKKYFTIVQYDDGILNDISHLDIKVFSMSGGRIDYPLPLIAQPLPTLPRVRKDIFCSFVGNITHPIRKELFRLQYLQGYYMSTSNHKTKQFANILNRSQYVLCPRGYGPTSFRIQEALQYGAVPVYVSDKWIEPHNENNFMWCLKIEDDIDAFLREMSGVITEQMARDAYQKYFTYEANKRFILTHSHDVIHNTLQEQGGTS